MNALIKKPNLLYLIFVRKCYNLKFWLRSLHRNKLLKAITICVIKPNKTKWYIKPYDKLIKHREDGPAIIWPSGTQSWYKNGKLHRENGPAEIWSNGTQYWYINDKLHREDGPAVIYADGTQCWYMNNKKHNDNGPAEIWAKGSQYWYINGKPVDLF